MHPLYERLAHAVVSDEHVSKRFIIHLPNIDKSMLLIEGLQNQSVELGLFMRNNLVEMSSECMWILFRVVLKYCLILSRLEFLLH
jgi:hypothetical protein